MQDPLNWYRTVIYEELHFAEVLSIPNGKMLFFCFCHELKTEYVIRIYYSSAKMWN